MNEEFKKSFIQFCSDYQLTFRQGLELFVKAMSHKYLRREGGPGDYTYYYQLPSGEIVSSKDPKLQGHKEVKLEEPDNDKTNPGDIAGAAKKQAGEPNWPQFRIDEKNGIPNLANTTILVHKELAGKTVGDDFLDYYKEVLLKQGDGNSIPAHIPPGGMMIAGISYKTNATLKPFLEEAKNPEYKKIFKDSKSLAKENNLEVKSIAFSGGSWYDFSQEKMVLEPSQMMQVKGKIKDVLAFASTIGEKYGQQAMYICQYDHPKAKGYEYSIEFEDVEQAHKLIKDQAKFGFVGSSLDVVGKKVYFGDPEGQMMDKFEELYNHAKNKYAARNPSARKAKIAFLERKDYGRFSQRKSKKDAA